MNKTEQGVSSSQLNVTRVLGAIVGTLGVILAIYRASDAWRGRTVQFVDYITLLYLLLPMVVVTLPRLSEFSLTKDGMSFKQLQRELTETREIAETNTERLDAVSAVVKRTPGGAPGRAKSADEGAEPQAVGSLVGSRFATEAGLPPITDLDDPQKGRGGGACETKFRRLKGDVRAVRGDDDYFRVLLRVESTDVRKAPLSGLVRFHVHDTFHPDVEDVEVKDGVATLELYAWRAFTVGAEADNGGTRLELDLSELPGVPKLFA